MSSNLNMDLIERIMTTQLETIHPTMNILSELKKTSLEEWVGYRSSSRG